jgi:signal transduction histidine kinase
MAESIAEELRQGAPQRRAEFAIEPGVSVLGDAVLLRSVLQNLLANAWKYSANTGLARIAFGRGDSRAVPGEAVDGDIVCFVSDNGAGFDPALAADLFQPFKRLHAARDFQGHGLGLAMAKRIIDRHSGRIWAEGQPGQGARFWFSLPGFNTAPRSAGQ